MNKFDSPRVKMVCPICKGVYNIPEEMTKGTKINGVKCRSCFKDRSVFVNLILTKFEERND